MSYEMPFSTRNVEDPIQEVAFTELPSMLNIAQSFIDERITMGSVTKAIRSGFYRDKRFGYKIDFLVNYNYLTQAVEETDEFTKANLLEKAGELGDILLHFLHFANGAGISADDVVPYTNSETLLNYQKTKLSLPTKLASLIFQKPLIPSIVRWYKKQVRADNIELLGAMSGIDAPWTLDRQSQKWCDYQMLLASNWALVFGTVCQYALQNNIPLLETIYQTTSKASYNFPPPFFKPEFAPFFSGPTSNNREIVCCRLFRKILTEPNETLIDQYHLMFNEQKIKENPKFFRQWVYESLLSILNGSKNNDFKSQAYWLLKDFKWESLDNN